MVDRKGWHLEDSTWENATCVHVSPLPGKCHGHCSMEPGPQIKDGNWTEEGRRGTRGVLVMREQEDG